MSARPRHSQVKTDTDNTRARSIYNYIVPSTSYLKNRERNEQDCWYIEGGCSYVYELKVCVFFYMVVGTRLGSRFFSLFEWFEHRPSRCCVALPGAVPPFVLPALSSVLSCIAVFGMYVCVCVRWRVYRRCVCCLIRSVFICVAQSTWRIFALDWTRS